MSPATIAIIPIVLAIVGIWAGWFFALEDEPMSDRIPGAAVLLIATMIALGLIVYFTGVVYFNSWEF